MLRETRTQAKLVVTCSKDSFRRSSRRNIMASQADHEQQSTSVAMNATPTEDFQQLLREQTHFQPLPHIVAAAQVKDYQTLYDEASSDFVGFWEKIAQEFTWEKPWTRVLEGQVPKGRWFVDGQLNITINCLDRHVAGSRANKRA